MITESIRKKTEFIINFIAKPFIYFHFPNMISFLGVFIIIILFPMLKGGHFYISAMIILLNGLLDVIDGAVARATGKSSAFGKLIDRTLDKVSDGAILAAYIVYNLVSLPLGIYTMIVMFLATNVSSNIEAILHLKISDAVSMRFVRMVVLVSFTILQQFNVMFIILAIVSTYAFFYRIKIAYSMYYNKKVRNT